MTGHSAGRPPADPGVAPTVIDAVRGLDLAMESLRTAVAQRFRVTVSDTLVLSVMQASATPLTPTVLAARLQVTTGTLTAMLDRLENAGMILRSANPRDRRSLLIELSADGRNGLADVEQRIVRAMESAVEPELRERLAVCLDHLTASIDEVSEALGPK